ncbi:cysteine synthase A [Leptospira sp. GIMC2001]|uniref:cysteine synthase A n=1 Tax=Leptospira sp. GIMC2001 TaxID=1513297 RepID=UPI002349001C|nr:cysteine synthase A [Leptospira sp. GIMC2001]WCL51304.1 cysteine synthase A [Leptospira sp. GIMC2001]
MAIYKSFSESVGNTPLIRLNSISNETGCDIYGKAEFMNPGGSVKDRAAKYIIESAERDGRLKKGMLVVEGTAGNTGIGVAHICNSKGYKTVIVMPESQAQEKKDILRTLGAELILAEVKPYSDPGNYQRQAEKIANERNGFWVNQFDNIDNRRAHFESTAPEIFHDLNGKIDFFTTSIGTGGTYAGISQYFKSVDPKIQTWIADPYGSGIGSYYETGELKAEGNSFTEGIGNMRITKNLEGSPCDGVYHIPDQEAIESIYRMLYEDGLFMGGSVGINVASAYRLAKQFGPGKTIVTILCDTGAKYQSKIFNREWLNKQGIDTKKLRFS